MGDSPEPLKRLEWPGMSESEEEQDDLIDPEGHWLPDSNTDARSPDPLTFETIFRDDRRWAPQHGLQGRSDSALPGAFLFPEATPRDEPVPDFVAEPVAAPTQVVNRRTAIVREFVETALLAVLVFLAVRASVQHYRVEGESMDPTLESGEFLLVNSLVYSEVNLQKIADWVPFWDPGGPDVRHVFHAPERGDIIILNPRQRHDRDLVKRIVGIPGDTFEIHDGNVYVNGNRLIEPYINEPWRGEMAPIQIPAHNYFVMGDNRNASLDSRAFGLVVEDDIIGKAMASWWPKEKWGPAGSEEPKFAPN